MGSGGGGRRVSTVSASPLPRNYRPSATRSRGYVPKEVQHLAKQHEPKVHHGQNTDQLKKMAQSVAFFLRKLFSDN